MMRSAIKRLQVIAEDRGDQGLLMVVNAAKRYEYIRTLTVPDFAKLYQENLKGLVSYDTLVDHAIHLRNNGVETMKPSKKELTSLINKQVSHITVLVNQLGEVNEGMNEAISEAKDCRNLLNSLLMVNISNTSADKLLSKVKKCKELGEDEKEELLTFIVHQVMVSESMMPE
jgi:hypothetical protein